MTAKIRKTKALTLIEITVVICIVGILLVAITSLSGDKELINRYRAEGCIHEINGKIKKFMNAALTSKKLTVLNAAGTGPKDIFPDYYLISFTGGANSKITFRYDTWSEGTGVYEEILLSGYCKERVSLIITGNLSFTTVKMNRGFQQIKPQELKTFALLSGSDENIFTWTVQINLCNTDQEGCLKVFHKRVFNTKSQGANSIKCKFYHKSDSNLCKTRDDEDDES